MKQPKQGLKQNQLAKKIIAYMLANKMNVSKEPGTFNIVYVEGVEQDGTSNADLYNRWNDRRMVIAWDADLGWQMEMNVSATTEPGHFYTVSPPNPKGVARIAFGQYKAWRVGMHKDQRALVQVAPVTVHRDGNRNGIRDKADNVDTGLFGINQHTTMEKFDGDTVGKHSAGCLVGRSYAQHNYFIGLIEQDARYQADYQYIFETAIINGDLLAKFRG